MAIQSKFSNHKKAFGFETKSLKSSPKAKGVKERKAERKKGKNNLP